MNGLDPVMIGIGFLAAGLFCTLLAWQAVGLVRRFRPKPQAELAPFQGSTTPNNEAVLIIEPGGQIVYSNAAAREWLGISPEQRPDLERLARAADPADSFLSLCAGEGRARLSLQGIYLEGTSYAVPYNGSGAMAVTLRKPRLTTLSGSSKGLPQEAIDILSDLSRAMSASLDLETTLEAVLDGISRLVYSDFSEIGLWDAEHKLLIPYRYFTDPDGGRRLERARESYREGEGLSGYLIAQQSPILVDDLNEFTAARPAVDLNQFPIRSFAGVPMVIAGEPIGTIELASLKPEAFRQEDLDLLQLLSGQAAVAIQNARTHEHEQQRLAELAGLANLAQAAGSLSDPQDLYDRLMQSLVPLLDVEILGLLVYEENRRMLEGKIPFKGLPEQFTALYRAEIAPGSRRESILLSQETILTEDAAEDERFEALGLMALIQAAGVVNTALVPITSGGRSLGYLQASNKVDGSLLTNDELRLMAIIAGQIGPIIENAHLVQEARRRARQAEAMNRISSLAGSGATVDEILKFAVLELTRFLGADYSLIYLADSETGYLSMHPGSGYGFQNGDPAAHPRLHIDDPEFRSTASGSLRPVIHSDLANSEPLPGFYQVLLADMPTIQSLLSVPLEVRDTGVGELILGSRRSGALGENEAQVAATAARQLATAIERSSADNQSDDGLRRQMENITALNRLSRTLNNSANLQEMLVTIAQEAAALSRSDRSMIRVVSKEDSPANSWNIDHHAGDYSDRDLLSVEIEALESGIAISANQFSEPDQAALDESTHSVLTQPILFNNQPIGLITLESSRSTNFNEGTALLISGLANQIAATINSASNLDFYMHQASHLDKQVSLLRELADTLTPNRFDEGLAVEMDLLAHEIREAADFGVVTIMTMQAKTRQIQPAGVAGSMADSTGGYFAEPKNWDEIEECIKPEFQIGPAYRIPASWFKTSAELQQTSKLGPGQWSSGDLLVYPLLDDGGEPVGLVGLEGARSIWPDGPFAESLAPFIERAAALAIRNRQLNKLGAGLAKLGIKVGDGAGAKGQATEVTRTETAPLDQIAAFSHLNQRVRQMRSTLDIAEVVNQQPDRPSILWALGQEILKRMDVDLVLVADRTQTGPRLLHSIGDIPKEVNPNALFGRRNPLRASFENGELLLVGDINQEDEWRDMHFLSALEAGAFIAMPIAVNGGIEAAVLAIRRTPVAAFSDDDRQIYNMLASQVGIALQNLNLLTDTRRRLREVDILLDFSRQLGSLDPDAILNSLISSTRQVVAAAHAGMVALWDEQDGLLLPKAADGYTDNRLIREIKCRAGEALPGRVFASGEPLVVDELDFAKKYKLPSESLMLYREATGGRLPVSSMVIPLQTAGDPLGVIVLDNFNTTSAFTPEDVALITSLAQQTALSLENARLFQAADERAAQLRSLTEVSATVTSSLQTDDLIATLLDQFATLVPFDTGTLWLRMGNQLTIRAARGFDETEGRIGLTANVEDSQLLHEMVTAGQPISVENTHADARFPALVEHPYLSWLGIPLISKGEVVGVIALEKLERAFYNQEHIQIARTFAAQATVALENARLFEESLRRTVELDERSRRLDRLNLTSTELSKSLDPDYIMVFTISELQQALGADGVAAVLFDEQGNPVLQAENPSRGEKLPKVLPDLAVFSRLKETLGVFTTAEVTKEADLKPLEDFLSQRKARSLALIPMATGSELHGLVMVYAEKNARFPAGEVELATTITNQAAIAFQNARQYEETRQFSFELEKRVAERTRELENEHRRTEILLKIITELSASLDLDIIINRTLELINEITGAEQSTVLLVQPEEANFIFRASQGFTTPPPGGGEETWLKVDEGLAGWVIKNQQGVLIPDLSEDARWLKKTDQVTEHRSAIAVPLVAGAESLGTLMIFHREPGRFSIDLLDLVKAIAQQIAVSINNAQLYLLIRDQAERLGGMLRSQQVETTRSRAILESVAEGILVTDSKGVITLFNQAGEEILGLEQRLIMDQALDEFSGLFGRAAYSWMETIRYWSTDPASAQSSEAFDQEIQLEDGRVVAVSLSPVILRDEFLGTVSIFHDITHQVEVDRLKSEFVATVSHELRTPMTSIKGYVEVLLMGAAGELSEKQQKFLEIVRVNTERLNILVDDLLDISRIEAGKVNLSLQPLDVREIAERSIDIVRQRSKDEDKPIAIDFQPQDNLPRIMGDPGRISQIVSNLVDNAYNYTPENGKITVLLVEADNFVKVDVQDNGIGIRAEEQDRVFERFYRGEDPLVLATAGTGLGLSIVRQLVEMHGGTIWLESSGISGEGSKFSFKIPVYKPESETRKKEKFIPEVSL